MSRIGVDQTGVVDLNHLRKLLQSGGPALVSIMAANNETGALQPVAEAAEIVHAAGGPSTVHTQLVQRTLDLTWHALYEDAHEPVRWCPAPPVRAAHVRDLTRWNDHPRRTADEVVGLLHTAQHHADAQTELLQVR